MPKVFLSIDPPGDAATQAYAEQLVSDYLRARQDAINLETHRQASDKFKAEVQALFDGEKATQDAAKADAAARLDGAAVAEKVG